MPRYVEDLHRDRDDDDAPPPAFECLYCYEVFDCDEGVILTRHPEMPTVCLNCACSS